MCSRLPLSVLCSPVWYPGLMPIKPTFLRSTSLKEPLAVSILRRNHTSPTYLPCTMSPAPSSPTNRLIHPARASSHNLNDAIRKRVCKACDRCRLKKTKCDGSSPCSRCKADNAICAFGYAHALSVLTQLNSDWPQRTEKTTRQNIS
jgi:hypothetical protein